MPSTLGTQPHKISRQEVQAVAAKNMELRALHAALFQAGSTSSPSLQSLPSATTAAASRASHHFSAEDYPVFTPVDLDNFNINESPKVEDMGFIMLIRPLSFLSASLDKVLPIEKPTQRTTENLTQTLVIFHLFTQHDNY